MKLLCTFSIAFTLSLLVAVSTMKYTLAAQFTIDRILPLLVMVKICLPSQMWRRGGTVSLRKCAISMIRNVITFQSNLLKRIFFPLETNSWQYTKLLFISPGKTPLKVVLAVSYGVKTKGHNTWVSAPSWPLGSALWKRKASLPF